LFRQYLVKSHSPVFENLKADIFQGINYNAFALTQNVLIFLDWFEMKSILIGNTIPSEPGLESL